MLENIENIIKDFFDKLQVKIDELEIITLDENIISIKIQTPDSWVLIGTHWKNLDAIEHILKQIISNKLDQKIKLHIEVNNYVESKDERLFSFIKSKIEYLKKSDKEDIRLPFLWAYERKKVHSFIAELNDTEIYTKSIWEWKERRLHVFKKDSKVTIDIDWYDI